MNSWTGFSRRPARRAATFGSIFCPSTSKGAHQSNWTISFVVGRDDPSVLWIFYEDLLESEGFAKSVKLIAGIALKWPLMSFTLSLEFMNIKLDDDLFHMTKQLTSMDSMRGMKTKFDDHFVRCRIDSFPALSWWSCSYSKISSKEWGFMKTLKFALGRCGRQFVVRCCPSIFKWG